MIKTEHQTLVVYDGVCNFCNAAVRFIHKRDRKQLYRFTPMQSDYGKQVILDHDVPEVGVDTFLLLKHGRVYLRSSAALEIANDLRWPWPVFGLLRFIPSRIRDFFYVLFAKNRYRLFGRQSECVLPNDEQRQRFLL